MDDAWNQFNDMIMCTNHCSFLSDLNQIKYQMDSKNLNNFITFVKLEDLPDIVPPEERLVQLGFDDQVLKFHITNYCYFMLQSRIQPFFFFFTGF